MKEKIKALAEAYEKEVVEIRRHLHRYPELSTRERKTAAFIAEKLSQWDIPYKTGYSGNGIVAVIKGRNPKKACIALRAEMDALPIVEETGLAFASVNKGVMHACGHDVHIACLLGAAKILKTLEKEFEGSVKLIFQPSEEDYQGGAPQMIADGALENPRPEVVYALHILPELECGKIGCRPGRYMASTDEVYLRVIGQGGHGATPEKNVDAVLASAYIITALQQIVSRYAPPAIPTVLSFGRIIGEGQTNVMPAEVNIAGTFRTFDEKWRAEAHKRIVRCARQTAQASGARCEVDIRCGYPCTDNDTEAAARVIRKAESLVGKRNTVALPIRMTADDFAFYLQEIPGCMFRLGVRPKELKNPANLHTSRLVVDESCIKTGMALLALLVADKA